MNDTPTSPDFPFHGATGHGLKIAVIDSGVNPAHSHISAIAGGVAVSREGAIEEGLDSFLDRLGHGTAVTAAIQEKAPAAQYFAVKVFHDALQTRALTLARAIDWCLAQHMDIINLSLGTVNDAYIDVFADAAARAAAQGALLVAAREANGQPCFPGSLPGVIGVGLDWDIPRETYRVEIHDGAPVYFATGYPRPIPGVAPTRNLYGISFAVANMCGFIVRARAAMDPVAAPDVFAEMAKTLAVERPTTS
jgi:subtilisin family serine protease